MSDRLSARRARIQIIRRLPGLTTIRPPAKRGHWIFSANPHQYHWDTLFVKGKEMWRGAGTRPDAIRALKQVRRGDRVLCYHSAPERANGWHRRNSRSAASLALLSDDLSHSVDGAPSPGCAILGWFPACLSFLRSKPLYEDCAPPCRAASLPPSISARQTS